MNKSPNAAAATNKSTEYILQLFITGTTLHSMMAVKNIKQLCEEFLSGHYQLEIIDVYQQPKLAEEQQLIATPTLIKVSPSPCRRFIGDLSDTKILLSGLSITN